MKLFKTSSIDTVKHCQEYFGFDLPSLLWAERMQTFEVKFGLYLSSKWISVSAMSSSSIACT